VLKEGDVIPGLGVVTWLSGACVDDRAHGVVLVDSDFSDLLRDEALVLAGALLQAREGDPVPGPAGATIDGFSSFWRTNDGDVAMILGLRPLVGVPFYGVYWNERLLALEDFPVGAPEVSLDTSWHVFDALKMNADNTVLVLGEVLNPDVPGPREDVLVRFQLDSAGNLLATNVLATKAMFLPALNDVVATLGSTEHALALNEHGDFITYVKGATTPGAILINLETIVAQEGSPSPVAGRNWSALGAVPRVSINDFGEYLFSGTLDGLTPDIYLIVKNGQKFAQEGDILPAFSASPLSKGWSAPNYIANSGDVYWLARTSARDDDAFMRNDRPILQENRTVVGGALVLSIEVTENAFHVSPDGRFFLGRVELQALGEALVLVDFGVVVPMPGCQGNIGSLRVTEGLALPGDHLTFALDDGQAAGVTTVLTFSTGAAVPGSDCGLSTPFGELLIASATRFATLLGPAWMGTAVSIDVPIPADLALVDTTTYVQGVFWDQGDVSPAENLRLTNGLRIEIGAP